MAEEHEEHGGGEDHGGDGHGGGGHGGGHGGGGHAEGEHEGAPEWLISFADNVALMMGFFVILLAMNMGPKADPKQGGEPDETNVGEGGKEQTNRQMDFVIGVREAFNTPIKMDSKNPSEQRLIKRMIEKQTRGTATGNDTSGKDDRNQAPRPSDYDKVTALIVFPDKSAALPSNAHDAITTVAEKQKDQRWIVEVRGHVSPFEQMHNHQKGMELSYQRALAVAQALVDAGMRWESLRVVACSDGDRVVKRSFDREADRGNQRVEIVVTNYVVPSDPYAAAGDN
ncbi:MAG: flagellar motor protein MotB [Phycisphaerales bacterium]